MSQNTRAYVMSVVETDDPAIIERRRHIVELTLAKDPELERKLENKGRMTEARSALRRVLARRGLVVSSEDDARIEACATLAVLERWHDEAVVAASAAEALR